jgi:hypothetical protein
VDAVEYLYRVGVSSTRRDIPIHGKTLLRTDCLSPPLKAKKSVAKMLIDTWPEIAAPSVPKFEKRSLLNNSAHASMELRPATTKGRPTSFTK